MNTRIGALLACAAAALATSCAQLSEWGLAEVDFNDMSIQQALDSLPPGGGEVRLKAGTYTIAHPVLLRQDGVTLRGAGAATVLRLADRANCPVIILGPIENFPKRTVNRLVLSDLTIDGNRTNQQTELWKTAGPGSLIRNNGVTVRSAHDSRVEHVTVFNCRSGGLVTEHGVRRLTISDLNSFGNEYDGLACYHTQDSVFDRLHLHHNPGAGLSLDLAFDGNIVSDSELSENDVGIFMRESRLNLFEGLVIRGCHTWGVFMSHAAEKDARGEWVMDPGTQCEGNSFVGLVVRDCYGPAFRVNETTCTNTLLIGAQLVNNPTGLSEVATGLVRTYGLVERRHMPTNTFYTTNSAAAKEPVHAGEP